MTLPRRGGRRRPAIRCAVAAAAAAGLLAGCADDPDEPDPAERIAEIADQVAELRGIDLDEPVDAELLAPDEFADLVLDVGDERTAQASPAEQDAATDVLVALRHIEEGEDLDAVMEEAVRGGVVSGIYVPEHETFYLPAEEGGLGPVEQVIAAHEIQHALQDRQVGLDQLLELAASGEADAFLAANAVVEGDAATVQERWSRQHQDPADRGEYLIGGGDPEAAAEARAALDELPGYLVEQLLFPYTVGADFVEALIEEGGYDAVDEALADPPSTTAEVMRPDRHFDGIEVVDATVEGDPGQGWEPGVAHAFGAFDLQMLLVHADYGLAARGVDTWSGGQLRSWQRGDEVALGATVAFEEASTAAAVCAALPTWYGQVAGGAEAGDVWESGDDVLAVSCGDQSVAFALAPDGDTAAGIVDG